MNTITEQDVANAIFVGNATQRRRAIRHLSSQVRKSWSMKAMEGNVKHSTLCPKYITVAKTADIMRDLDMYTHFGIALGKVKEGEVANAILNPEHHCLENPKTTSGYALGRPLFWDEATAKAEWDRIKGSYQQTEDLSRAAPPKASNTQPTGDTDMSAELTGEQKIAALPENMFKKTDFKSNDFLEMFDLLRPYEEAVGARIDIITKVTDGVGEDDFSFIHHLREDDFDEVPSNPKQNVVDAVAKIGGLLNGGVGVQPRAGGVSLTVPSNPDAVRAIDYVLRQNSMPGIRDIVGSVERAKAESGKVGEIERERDEAVEKLKEANKKIASASFGAPQVVKVAKSSDGKIPEGKVIQKKAAELFDIQGSAAKAFDYDIPCWEWDGEHPHVPEIDKEYMFRPISLSNTLYGITKNVPVYVQGHTGTGKTTLVEQIAARLSWPFLRVNFDSEITRMDLVGRDVIKEENGASVSKFVDGILPKMIGGPYISCFDEIDFVRPDVAYVMQRAFEGNGLMITEDGGRFVAPDPMFRMFATANTVGQGDEFGMYQGARPQSMAMLDRFQLWVTVDHMDADSRERLIKAKVPGIDDDMVRLVNQYVGEHIKAFTGSDVLQPISPRQYISFAETIRDYTNLIMTKSSEKDIVKRAAETTVLNRCSSTDRQVLVGLINRVFGVK